MTGRKLQKSAVLAAAIWAGAFGAASAQAQSSAPAQSTSPAPAAVQISRSLPTVSNDAFLDIRTFAIRPDANDGVTLSAFTPQIGFQTKSAVIIAPGGGYISIAANLEGRQVADWFTTRGVTAFVLKYRYGAANPLPAPIEDGERAVRYVRANAQALGIDPDRIGLMGFSAGGHLASMTVTLSDDGVPTADDPVERVSSRPDFLILGYPGLGSTQLQANGQSRYCQFARLGGRRDCRSEDYVDLTPFGGRLAAKAPPTFIYHTTQDKLVPAQESARLYLELIDAGVDVEAHLFARGAHGSGLGGSDPALSIWPETLEAWLRARGYLSRRVVATTQ